MLSLRNLQKEFPLLKSGIYRLDKRKIKLNPDIKDNLTTHIMRLDLCWVTKNEIGVKHCLQTIEEIIEDTVYHYDIPQLYICYAPFGDGSRFFALGDDKSIVDI